MSARRPARLRPQQQPPPAPAAPASPAEGVVAAAAPAALEQPAAAPVPCPFAATAAAAPAEPTAATFARVRVVPAPVRGPALARGRSPVPPTDRASPRRAGPAAVWARETATPAATAPGYALRGHPRPAGAADQSLP